jgi:large subunit ribosomal protein L4
MQITVKNTSGETVQTIEVSDDLFKAQVNVPVLHQALLREMAGQRKGTQDSKTRAEVSGGGRKPRPQKGSGRSRAGSTRSPIWVKGGKAHGPHPRSYAQRLPRKMWRLALIGALSSKASEERLVVLDKFGVSNEPRIKPMLQALSSLGVNGSALIVTKDVEKLLVKSVGNIPNVKVVPAVNIKLGDVLNHDKLLMTVEAVREAERMWASKAE